MLNDAIAGAGSKYSLERLATPPIAPLGCRPKFVAYAHIET